MASEKQIAKWSKEASLINDDPEYINAYIEYRQKAKKADQRLVRLEALAYDKHFAGLLEFAYARAINDIQSWGGNKRFNTAPPTTVTKIEAKIADIDTFLAKATSNKRDIMRFYNKRAKTMTDRYGKKVGVEFTWQEIANFYERAEALNIDTKKASKTLVRALAVIKKAQSDNKDSEQVAKDDEEALAKQIKDISEQIERVDASQVVKRKALALIKQGYTYDDLMGGK